MNTLQQFLRQEEGAAAIEYGLLAGLIAIAIIVTATNVGLSLQGIFTAVSAALAAAV